MNAVVQSTIVGDRLSTIQIGSQGFVGEAGTYLAIQQDPEAVGTLDAIVGTGGSLTLVGADNATLASLTGTAGIVGDSVYIQTIPTTGGNILVEANDELALGAINDAQLASTTGNVNITTLAGDINVNSADALTLAGANNVALGSSAGDVNITSEVSTSITATTGNVNITSSVGNVGITSDGTITISANNNLGVSSAETTTISGTQGLVLSSPEVASLTSTTNEVNITGNTDVNVVATTNDISLTAGNNINLTAGAGDKVIVNSTLDLTDKNVINADTITGQGALTLATTGATNLNLSPATGGVIVGNKNLSMGTINAITNCIGVSSDNALAFTANNGNVNLTATGSGNRILLNSDASMGNRTLFNFTGTNVGGIYGLTTQPLVLAGQQATPAVRCGGTLAMWQNGTTQGAGNSITGITTLNGRNIFSYGNFYNTANQTLGAINTATRVVMNTSANNNLITLDTTTNIGRITFTNAGVYHVVWNAYLIHGSGGTAKSCIWIRLNGTDVAGSGKTENNDNQQNETNMTSSSLINATANQYIEFFWAADSTTVPLTAIAASAPFPATPSFSCTISIVG
jgi:uncharacterized protein (DUF2345 family)